MKTKLMLLIEWAGGSKSKLARRCGTTRQNVNKWMRMGRLPSVWAVEIERLSDGRFKAIDMVKGDLDHE
jgi:transcriptional regulator with XRE-family HTH domain